MPDEAGGLEALLAASSAQALWILVACRLLGLFLAAPFFRSGLLPWRVKIGMLGVLTLCVGSSVSLGADASEAVAALSDTTRPIDAGIVLAGELFVGCVLGWTALLVFGAIQGAARVISQQIGLAASSVADPQGDPAAASDGGVGLPFLYHSLAIVLFLALDLHHALIRAVVTSFDQVPPGTLSGAALPAFVGRLAVEIGPDIFVAAVVLCFPVLLALFLVSIVQGALGRVLPEVELFTLGMPARILVGLTVLVATLPTSMRWVGRLLRSAVSEGSAALAAWQG